LIREEFIDDEDN
ncbi:putative Bet3 transport protein, partial [Toxoplasma gondii FOU]